MSGEADLGSVTSLLKRVDPAWWWLRANFKLPSLAVIASLVACAGGWLLHEHLALGELAKRPDLGPQIAGLAARLDADEKAWADHNGRIEALERWQDRVTNVAESPPRRRRR